MPHVAVIGMGRMGAAMARRLAEAGFELTLWNRTSATARSVADDIGAQVASTAEEAAASAEIVLASLADDAAVTETHLGAEGVLAGASPGSVVIETSTVDPRTITELGPRYTERGAHLLDSPVSGSVALVEQGALTAMVGGEADALDRVRPILDALTKAVYHLGPNGTGATMKLAVNSLVHATNLAISEALLLAERAGVERSKAYEVFANSAAASPFLLYKRVAFERPEETPVAFSVDLMQKDLDLILTLAERVGLPMAQLGTTSDVTGVAVSAGFGDRDMSSLATLLREGMAASGPDHQPENGAPT
ncbi:MAG TPA: NAD(P)-dependent oxidoreductase [Acidimicrobiia bacterium]|nr:NAD(P)-dependent oxidoreductase [Acidimicrobiia bacterium]